MTKAAWALGLAVGLCATPAWEAQAASPPAGPDSARVAAADEPPAAAASRPRRPSATAPT